MKSFKGSVLYYRIYDIGQDIDLKKAQELLNRKNLTEQFKLKRPQRSLIIDQAPIVIAMGQENYEVLGKIFSIVATAKLWHFGSISILFKIVIPVEFAMEEFKNLAYSIENDSRLETMARDTALSVLKDLSELTGHKSVLWEQVEDYTIYNLDPSLVEGRNYAQLLDSQDLYQLILTETTANISAAQMLSIRANSAQYAEDDLTVLDWNSAFICSRDDAQDLCDVIEFGLCQSLELRYYDDRLDRKLSTLYKAVKTHQGSIFSSPFSKLAEEAALFYIEISEIKEKVNNSLKVIGDIHYAKIYRMALERFRVKDWNNSIEEKLDNLKEVALIFQSDINERRNLLLEITIILLIAIEVIPLLWGIFVSPGR